MNVVKCTGAEKHFFDGDIYPVCPFCGSPAGNAFDTAAREEKETSEKDIRKDTKKDTKKQKNNTKTKKTFFSKWKKKKQRDESDHTDDIPHSQDPGKTNRDDGDTDSNDWRVVSPLDNQKDGSDSGDNDVTLDIWQTSPKTKAEKTPARSSNNKSSDKPSKEKENQNDSSTDDQKAVSTDDQKVVSTDDQKAASTDDQKAASTDDQKAASTDDQNAVSTDDQKAASTDDQKVDSTDDQKVSSEPIAYFIESDKSQSRSESEEESLGSLFEKVKNASASSEGKTMSYFSAITYKANEAYKPQTLSAHVDPVVGWLICIQGEHFGESFQLGAGLNSIGRSENNRIVLDHDPSVSREKHALITYEPKHRVFYFKLGNSSGLAYVNDEYITETKKLSARDTIELGNTKFVFVPLCGEDFTWEDFMKG